jgi:GNAT superfamily N-acetyltransferase
MAANQGGAFHTWARRLGRPHGRWQDLVVGDLGSETPETNVAGLLRRMDGASESYVDDVLDRVLGVFSRSGGGAVQLWSAWPTPDISGRGWRVHPVPGMVREPARAQPRTPPALEIIPAADPDTLAAAEQLISDVFRSRAQPGSVLTPDVLADDLVVWLGIVDGRPVATATTYVSDGLCGVYAVATAADARRRGYGEALTWAATLHRPELPAALQASPMGRPVYERMGYRRVVDFTVWQTARPHRPPIRGSPLRP